jgi:AcrR family transcriptional regulator
MGSGKDVLAENGIGPKSAAQNRIIAAARDLFAAHGVGGTSLQMIADAIGVSKAAVYHQYRTKEEIVVAVAEAELADVEAAVAFAEAEPSATRARLVLITRMVDLAVSRRRVESSLLGDPVIVRYFAHHQPFARVMDRLSAVLIGDDDQSEARVPAAMLTAAIGGAVMHPLVADLDDETLRSQLRRLALRFLDLPE